MTDLTRRGLAGLLTAAGAAPALIGRATAAQPADILDFVDPDLRPAARMIQGMDKAVPPLSAETLPAWRKMGESFGRPPLATTPYVRRTIPGPKGAPDVTIFVINAKPGTRRPAILHTHGGGFVTGAAGVGVRELQELTAALDCCVVTVDYRLAPEATFRDSMEDNYAGLRWLRDHAAELGVDPSRIAVMGESAGGGHAALLAILARDRKEIPLAFQLLVYPMLDDRTGSLRKPPTPMGRVGWNAEANRFGWRAFLGGEPGGPNTPIRAVPARTADLAGLPPTFIGVGSIDLFVEEDIDYAWRLIEAGVSTELVVVPGAFHGFDMIAAATPPAQRFAAAKIAALRRALWASG